MDSGKRLSIEFFNDHDPDYMDRGEERRYLCPFCGHLKPSNDAHRSCCINVFKSIWGCKRCKRSGRLDSDLLKELSPDKLEELNRKVKEKRRNSVIKYCENLQRIENIRGTKGAVYLAETRGIDLATSFGCNVKFSADFYGGPAVVFPLRDDSEKVVAVSGRYIESWRELKHRSAGNKMAGYFRTPGFLESRKTIICEAPIDALTIFQFGYPCAATCGSGLQDSLLAHCYGTNVTIATDSDVWGDDLFLSWSKLLFAVRAKVSRARPIRKDWNQVLTEISLTGCEVALNDSLSYLITFKNVSEVESYIEGFNKKRK